MDLEVSSFKKRLDDAGSLNSCLVTSYNNPLTSVILHGLYDIWVITCKPFGSCQKWGTSLNNIHRI